MPSVPLFLPFGVSGSAAVPSCRMIIRALMFPRTARCGCGGGGVGLRGICLLEPLRAL